MIINITLIDNQCSFSKCYGTFLDTSYYLIIYTILLYTDGYRQPTLIGNMKPRTELLLISVGYCIPFFE